MIGAATLLVVNFLVVRYLYKHRELDELVEGSADYLIRRGKVNQRLLEKELITIDGIRGRRAQAKHPLPARGGKRHARAGRVDRLHPARTEPRGEAPP